MFESTRIDNPKRPGWVQFLDAVEQSLAVKTHAVKTDREGLMRKSLSIEIVIKINRTNLETGLVRRRSERTYSDSNNQVRCRLFRCAWLASIYASTRPSTK